MMSRMKALFAAGGLTGLVLATILALGLRDTLASGSSAAPALDTSLPVTAPAAPAVAPTLSAGEEQALREQNQQLRAALQTMQEREALYQQQVETANQSLLQLQSAQQAAPPAWSFAENFDEDDEHEEHEDHEQEHDD